MFYRDAGMAEEAAFVAARLAILDRVD